MLGPSLRMQKKLEYPPGVKTCVLGAQKICLIETVLLSTHNICFG